MRRDLYFLIGFVVVVLSTALILAILILHPDGAPAITEVAKTVGAVVPSFIALLTLIATRQTHGLVEVVQKAQEQKDGDEK